MDTPYFVHANISCTSSNADYCCIQDTVTGVYYAVAKRLVSLAPLELRTMTLHTRKVLTMFLPMDMPSSFAMKQLSLAHLTLIYPQWLMVQPVSAQVS